MSTWHRLVGPDQHRLKRRILVERARYRCETCESRVTASKVSRVGARRCELHHIQPLSRGGFHTPENVLLLCRDCHLEIHREDRLKLMPPKRRAWARHLETY